MTDNTQVAGNDAYDQTVAEIRKLQHKFSGKISLEPMQELMAALDSPQDATPVVHVAGTNGKGSTVRILAAILQEAGYTVGTYTSPHLTDLRERIQVNGEWIARNAVVDHYRRIAETGVDISYFECTTALAFLEFAERDVDIAVMETGMGGRLDATNVANTALAVITNVSLDHTGVLGETPEQIAYEKAGIIKDGVPVVSGAAGDPQQVIADTADQCDAPLHKVTQQVTAERPDAGQTLRLQLADTTTDTQLIGGYQVDNVNTALTARDRLREQGYAIPRDAVIQALETVQVPGRMERVSRQPLVLLDGAHNPAGMEKMADTMCEVKQGAVTVVVSIMVDKDYAEMLATVEAVADSIVLSQANVDRAAEPAELADCIMDMPYEIIENPEQAVEQALASADDEDTVLVTGSLYFIGDVKPVV